MGPPCLKGHTGSSPPSCKRPRMLEDWHTGQQAPGSAAALSTFCWQQVGSEADLSLHQIMVASNRCPSLPDLVYRGCTPVSRSRAPTPPMRQWPGAPIDHTHKHMIQAAGRQASREWVARNEKQHKAASVSTVGKGEKEGGENKKQRKKATSSPKESAPASPNTDLLPHTVGLYDRA